MLSFVKVNAYNKNMRSKLLFFFLLSIISFSLKAQFGYLYQSRDSLSSAVFIDQGHKKNTLECLVLKYDSITHYSPEEIYGYSILGGPRYYSKKVKVDNEYKSYFLELIGEAKHKLFYLNHDTKRFFLEVSKDSLYEIKSKKNGKLLYFDEQLAKLLDECDYVTSQSNYVKFTKSSMKLFLSSYTECSKKPLPRFKYGAFLYYGMYQYQPNFKNEKIELLDFTYTGTSGFGVFIDQPLYVIGLSFHIEMLYFKQASVTYYESNIRNVDFVGNAHTFNIPAQLRYTLNGRKLRPYISGGFVFSYNIITDAELSWAEYYDDNTIRVYIDEDSYLSKRQFGFVFGLGFEYQAFKKYALFTGIKYESLYGKPDNNLNMKFINFNLGIII